MPVEAKPIFLMPTARRDNPEISRRFPTSSPDHQVLHGSKEGLRATHHSRSRTTAADFKSFNANSTLALSNDISGSRISQEITRPSSSIYLHRERSDNLAKSLMARGSKLLKRQNSTASLKTWQWLETSHDGTGVYESQLAHSQDGLAHSRIRSTGSK